MERSVALMVLTGGLLGGAATTVGIRAAASAHLRETSSAPWPTVKGVVRSALNPSVQACADFYRI